MKLLVIANPSAGRGRCARLLPEIRAGLETTGHEIEFFVSENKEHLLRLGRLGVEQRVDAIVACGGDGTAHYLLQGLVPSDVALGMIPVGTGNDWARNVGLPTDYRMAYEVLQRGNTKLIDVARAGEQLYVSVAGAGFDSEVNRLANQNSVWLRGKAVYLNAVFRTLSQFKPKPVAIEYDDRRFAGEVMLVAVGNGASYGGGLKIVPQAKPDDGWLDLCIVKKTSRLELVRNLPLLYRGEHVHHPAIEIHRARRVTISSPDRMELFGDGEYLQTIPVTIEVIPQALRVIVP